MKKIFIFDIDGCVLPSIFPNIHEDNQSKEKIIKNALEIGDKISLFPDFIEFYKKYCKSAESVIFITGRQKSSLGGLTETQLAPLREIKEFSLIYYPEEKSHIAKEYFDWKVNRIREILKGEIKKTVAVGVKEKRFLLKIFDDTPDYFPKIKEIADALEVSIILVPINEPDTWKSLIN